MNSYDLLELLLEIWQASKKYVKMPLIPLQLVGEATNIALVSLSLKSNLKNFKVTYSWRLFAKPAEISGT